MSESLRPFVLDYEVKGKVKLSEYLECLTPYSLDLVKF